MRLAPRSLYMRVVLVVIGGLIVAQALSTLLLFDERARWFLQGRISRSSHRIADAIHVLDTLPAAQRMQVAAGFTTDEFGLTVSPAPPQLAPSSTALQEAAQNLAVDLSEAIGQRKPVKVAVLFDPAEPPPAPVWSAPLETRVPATRIDAAVPSADGAQWYRVRWNLGSDSRGLPDRVLWEIGLRLASLLLLLLVAMRWVTRPLSVLAQAADRLGRNLDQPPIPENGPSEVSRAAQAFNQMQARLRDLVRQKAHLLAAVSHDLKTPITRLRLRAELLGDRELRDKIGRDLDEMESMVGATLDLMRGSGTVEPLQATDLLALVESLQADYEDMGHAIEVQASRIAPVELRPLAIRRCLANLIDNGLKYARDVRVVVVDDADRVQVRVEDQGPGIPEADLERVFEPFQRLEGSRNRETGGSGLGLSIARGIAVEHAGSLRLLNRPEGGLCACLELPRR